MICSGVGLGVKNPHASLFSATKAIWETEPVIPAQPDLISLGDYCGLLIKKESARKARYKYKQQMIT